ncbi:hypothetical protein SAMN05660405_02565 [Psychrobacter pacificensis]|uniref:Arc-like DNA binding domain-containing protein n=1 Tax=Psychrobacter pacificensis TaxID=112002 RepID=A0A1G7AQD2_9GAMM|nr:hypothetical protein [Psychrobacter pacificensis]GLR27799.1 hypothetical protein GCM10007915_00370 [Psychrobacter pacificensis]GLR28963.1 hypothetical protein GCM10007915_12010 [Psychrobacter pacificensis]SDE17001.1 hypothetical protein SAMN05660405_02565 [Psychrobacter pacificensis]
MAAKKTVDYKLKLDPELHHWLKNHAAENYRTLSAEITMHLDKARQSIQKEYQNAT